MDERTTLEEYKLVEQILRGWILNAPHEEPRKITSFPEEQWQVYREGQASVMWLLKQQLREALDVHPEPRTDGGAS